MTHRELIYSGRNGSSHMVRLNNDEDVYARLTVLRKRGITGADVWTVDDYGARITRIGGIDEIDGADDRRIKYQVWAERD